MLKGIRLNDMKNMSISNEIVDMSEPSNVFVPLINDNILCECITKKGRKVRKGTIIGIRKDIDFPILSPVSGTVLGIKKCLYLNDKIIDCVEIANDRLERVIKKQIVKDITSYTKEEFIDILKKCSISGMSGSDFPTYLKYECKLNTLIVNAVESEPYITSDSMLVKLKAEIILECIDAIMKINGIKKCFIAFKENNIIVKNSFLKYLDKYDNIILFPVKDVYPIGYEKYLIKLISNLDYDKKTEEVGIVMNNVTTIFAIYKALKFKRNITKRIITISGEGFTEPINVLVKIGTSMSSVIKKIGKYNGENLKIIANGPMMGNALRSDSVIATANLNGIVIIEDVNDKVMNCINCGKCLEVCPAKICPVFIMKNINDIEKLKKFKPEKCIECGLCSYICPSKIGLRDAVKSAKKKVMNK